MSELISKTQPILFYLKLEKMSFKMALNSNIEIINYSNFILYYYYKKNCIESYILT